MSLVKIKDVCEVIAGQSPEGKYYNSDRDGIPFYQGKKRFGEKFILDPIKWTTSVTKRAVKGDILMSVRAPVGPVNFAKENICIGRGLAAIRGGEEVDKEYLFYFLKHHESEIESNEGAVFNSINKTQIGNIEIPLPPLPEQKRIVEILDEALAAIDQAQANIERNIENAKELFQSKLNEVFGAKDDGWVVRKIGEIASFSQGIQVGLKHHKHSPEPGHVRFIRIVDYTQQNEDVRYVRDPGEKYFVQEDDIVMVRYGSPGLIGRGQAGVIANNLFRISITQQGISKDYLSLYLSQESIQKYLRSQGSSTMPALNFTQLRKVVVEYPPTPEQKITVESVNKLKNHISELQHSSKTRLETLSELKNSLLQKAFSGELTEKEVVL